MCEPLATGVVFQEMLYGAAVSSAPRLHAVEQELHAGDANVVGRVRRDEDGSSRGGAVGRSRDGGGWKRRVGDRDRHHTRGRGIARGVSRDGGQLMTTDRRCGRIPRDRVRSRGVFRTEVRAIKLELDAGDADIVGARRGDHARLCLRPWRRLPEP